MSESGLSVVVFTDLVGSTALLARLGDDRMQRVEAAHVADVRRAVVARGGVVHKSMGDGVMASFSSALAALATSADVVRDIEALDAREGGLGLAVRVGVSAGEPIAAAGDLHGMAVVIAARLCSAAQPGEVLVADLVRALVATRDGVAFAPAAEYELRGVPGMTSASALDWRSMPVPELVESVEPSVESAHAWALPRMLAGYASEPFVGRVREAGVLREALLGPGSGRRAAVVLGEPGIGKTRHAAALAEEAHAAGVLVVLARCPPEAATPFEPWVRGIGELVAAGDDAWRARLSAVAGTELRALVPELASGHLTDVSTGAADGALFRVLRGIGDVLGEALGDGERLLLVLDDAHWCDEGSVQALKVVLDSPVADRLSLLVTARDRELGRRHEVTKALNELRRTHELTELALVGLDDHGVAALLAARLGRAVTPRLVRRLRARTGGNPFFSAELAHDLEGRGALLDDAAMDAAPVPAAVADLVGERLERLDARTEDFLVAVAAIGPSAEVALAAAAAGISEVEVSVVVDKAVAERLVDEEPALVARVVFPHALIREALLTLRTPTQRARLHHAIAEQLSQRGAAEPSQLARHRELAAPVTGPEPAVVAHRLAADASAAAGDHHAAADHLDAAVSLAGPGATDRAPLLLALGDQRLLAADLRRGRVAHRAAAATARETGDVLTLARAALGDAGGDIGFVIDMPQVDPTGPALLREAIDALGDRDPILALGLSLRRAFALVFSTETAELRTLATNAGRLADLAGTDEARALATMVAFVRRAGRTENPLASFNESTVLVGVALQHAECAGRDDLLLRALQMAAFGAYVQADLPRLDALMARLDEVVTRLDAPRYTSDLGYLRGSRHVDRAEFAEADLFLLTCAESLRDIRGELQMIVETNRVLNDFYHTGDAARLHSTLSGITEGADIGIWRTTRAWSRARSGDLHGARAELDRLLGDNFESLRQPDAHLPLNLVLAALTAWSCDTGQAAPTLRPALERLRGGTLSGYPALGWSWPAEMGIGLLDLLEGKHDAALVEFDTALITLEAIDSRLIAPCARLYRALALHRRDGPGDRAAAAADLDTAAGQVQEWGLGYLRDEVARVRAELAGRPIPAYGSGSDLPQTRSGRALQARTGRRALSALVRNQDDETLERRFTDPRRQRTLLRAMARGFQPDHAADHTGAVIVYSLQPYAIEPPPDAPWRWAVQLGERSAHLLNTAPLDADVTIEFGLADWIRIMAGLKTPIASMADGRCRIDGDAKLAIRLEAIFSG